MDEVVDSRHVGPVVPTDDLMEVFTNVNIPGGGVGGGLGRAGEGRPHSPLPPHRGQPCGNPY